MLLLGIDLGTSSVKVSVVDAATRQCIAAAQYPETEAAIHSPQPGWAEQDPAEWWHCVQQAILACHASGTYDTSGIAAIGIAYQMHGLVLVDKNNALLRPSIIWCDSRAVETGNQAFHDIGEEKCLSCLLNSPGNFTASKLAWVKKAEPHIYEKVSAVMLPGDYIALKFSGHATTTPSALSEGMFWDFRTHSLSADILDYFRFDKNIFPAVQPVFSEHGMLEASVAAMLSLKAGIPVTYKAGDQLNNALFLNALEPGDVAATAGTSGVIYGVSGQLAFDKHSRINSFAHVNHTADTTRTGILLCINGAGSFNRWVKNTTRPDMGYAELNLAAAQTPIGAAGLLALPFGNGAERMLLNKIVGAHFNYLDLNKHGVAHMVRAAQEGIAFAFRYGLDIMRENGIHPRVIRAGRSNLFLSEVFIAAFAAVNGVMVELYEGDGSFGAAIGAGIGAGYFPVSAALSHRKPVASFAPADAEKYSQLYAEWKSLLQERLFVEQHKELSDA